VSSCSEKVLRVTSRACEKFLEEVQGVKEVQGATSRACWTFREEVQSVTSRACEKLLGKSAERNIKSV